MVDVSPKGFLRWRPGIITEGTSRNQPVNYMLMCGRLRSLEEHHPTLTTEDLIEIGPQEFETHEGEITGVNGLLRIVDRFPITLSNPKEVLLVGSISSNSLLSVLAWCKEKKWNKTHVTLVDKSCIPIRHLSLMQKENYFHWPGGCSLIKKDILKYKPLEPPKIIIADILNAWMVKPYHSFHLAKQSPYTKFEEFLKWGAETVVDNGWFFSRSMIWPPSFAEQDPNSRFAETAQKRANQIMLQLGDLARKVNRTAIEDEAEQLFNEPFRTTHCGLDRVYSPFRQERTLAGSHAEKLMRKFHHRYFQTVHEIRVQDVRSGFTFLNFACQSKNPS